MPFCDSNIGVPAFLATAHVQYHLSAPVLTKVNPLVRTEINTELIDTGTNTFHVREVTLLHPMDGCRYLDRSGHIQTIEPCGIRIYY